MDYVILETEDGIEVPIEFAVLVKRSRVFQRMNECRLMDNNETEIIPVRANYEPLLKILYWLLHHKFDEEPEWVHTKEEPDDIEQAIYDFDMEFWREKHCNIVEIMKVTDYFDIPWLKKLCALKLRIDAPTLYLEICD